jgi:hypothetical protein
VLHGKDEATKHGVVTPEYIDYNLHDVRATTELLELVLEEFARHPLRLDQTKAYSPAAIAKAYLAGMGITPPAIKFADVSPELLGNGMTAYYGGRAEARIRKTSVPVVHCDFLSMYTTVNTLMGLWRFLTAERLEVQDATREVQSWARHLTPEQGFSPRFWADLSVFAMVKPEGEILPARAHYGGPADGFNIGINPLKSRVPVWLAGPDLAGAVFLSGRAPHVLRAVRIVPIGQQKKLRSILLRGAIAVDPYKDDFFRVVVESRQRAKIAGGDPVETDRLRDFLKVLANSGGYGIFAEMIRTVLPLEDEAEIAVYGLDGRFPAYTNRPEVPGEYCFPLIAALIPAAARLMLALLEHEVTAAGGAYAMCDTDSMAIVATESGGPVPCRASGGRREIQALSWAQV